MRGAEQESDSRGEKRLVAGQQNRRFAAMLPDLVPDLGRGSVGRERIHANDSAAVTELVRGDFGRFERPLVGTRKNQRGADPRGVGPLEHATQLGAPFLGEAPVRITPARRAILRDAVAKEVNLHQSSKSFATGSSQPGSNSGAESFSWIPRLNDVPSPRKTRTLRLAG